MTSGHSSDTYVDMYEHFKNQRVSRLFMLGCSLALTNETPKPILLQAF